MDMSTITAKIAAAEQWTREHTPYREQKSALGWALEHDFALFAEALDYADGAPQGLTPAVVQDLTETCFGVWETLFPHF